MSNQGASEVTLEFTLGRERYAMPASAVQEVTEIIALQRVPKAPPVIAGLVDVRGRVITLLDLERVFGLEHETEGAPVALILAPPDAHLGLLVHGQPQVGRLDLSAAGAAEGLIDGVLLASDKLYNIVSPRRILAFCEKQVLEVFRRAAVDDRTIPTGRQA